jgi:hypothetical protein
MPGNVMLQDCTRHTLILSILANLVAICNADLRGLGSFIIRGVNGTEVCTLGEHACCRRTPKSWQACAIEASPKNLVTR